MQQVHVKPTVKKTLKNPQPLTELLPKQDSVLHTTSHKKISEKAILLVQDFLG